MIGKNMIDKIKFFDFSKILKKYKKDILKATSEKIDEGSFILGEDVKKFEDEFSKKVNSKYTIGVSNGTDALTIILKSLNLNKGSEVLVQSFTFISSASTSKMLGLKPVFLDLEKNKFKPNILDIKNKINKNTKAIIWVHLFGEHTDLTELSEFCKKNKIYLIEDCAQSFGSNTGNYGDASAYSFFPAKNLGCLGDGGAITTNSEKLYDLMIKIRTHGMKKKYSYEIIGGNYRLDSIQAKFLSIFIKDIDSRIEKRKNNARYYTKMLSCVNDIILPEISKNHSFNQFTILCKNRDSLKEFLFKNGIETNIYYPNGLHKYDVFKDEKENFPETDNASASCLSLPIYSKITNLEIKYISEKIKEFYNE